MPENKKKKKVFDTSTSSESIKWSNKSSKLLSDSECYKRPCKMELGDTPLPFELLITNMHWTNQLMCHNFLQLNQKKGEWPRAAHSFTQLETT